MPGRRQDQLDRFKAISLWGVGLNQGLWSSKLQFSRACIAQDSKGDYYRYLRESQRTFGSTKESITAWADYFLNILLTQAEKAAEVLNSPELDEDLSPKQKDVWRYLQEQVEAAPGQIAEATGIPRVTVGQALRRLTEIGQVKRLGRGRATRYKKL